MQRFKRNEGEVINMGLEDYIDMNVDYMDMSTMYLYHIQDYNQAKKFGLPTQGIRVTLNGNIIGYYDPERKVLVKN